MKIPLPNKLPQHNYSCFRIRRMFTRLLSLLLIGISYTSLWAEGSKDFINYPGKRMWLDGFRNQQIKVYAKAGEFINVGSSHVGVPTDTYGNGYIQVYRPDGTLAMTFDNTGASAGKAIIFNHLQEQAGPKGAGGGGYVPGVVPVGANEAGIWTVIFDFPGPENASGSANQNLENNQPWDRATYQVPGLRVILAWDVTVSTNFPGDQGGGLLEGRVYTNEYVTVVRGNGNSTSPSIFVLTDDGYLYQVNFNDTDPFRFHISSNSLGLVTGNQHPTYKSKDESDYVRSSDPATWTPNNFYLYEPQAADMGVLINHKLFFNMPNPDMPASAMVTDVYRNNTHTTWLNTTLQSLALQEFFLVGDDPDGIGCADWTLEFEHGGNFVIKTNLGGTVLLQLDLNNNGVFDACDRKLEGVIPAGTGMIHWDGKDGCGNFIPKQDSFPFSYSGVIRFGELHIGLNDVENNPGGVTFKWINAPPNLPDSLFYFDHSSVGGPVSGGVPPGNPPQPTSIPFKYGPGLPYGANFGNIKYLDQWFFIEYPIASTTAFINIVDDCPCSYSTPVLELVDGGGEFCAGESVTLSAQNTATLNISDSLTFIWQDPNGTTIFSEKIPSDQTSSYTIPSLTVNQAGNYKVYAVSELDCPSNTISIPVNVSAVPAALAIDGGGSFCEGEDVVLTVTNITPGVTTINYQWSGPGISEPPGSVTGNETIKLSIPSATPANSGTFTLTWESGAGCEGLPLSVDVNVNALPLIVDITPDGAWCEGDNITLTANNGSTGATTCNYVWMGPNGLTISGTASGSGPFPANLTNVSKLMEGVWVLSLVCDNGCQAIPRSVSVAINKTPEINAISPNGSFCEGTNVVLTAQNNVAGTGPLDYTWTGPNGYTFTGTGQPLGPFNAPLDNIALDNAGVYTLVLTAEGGCESTPQSVTIGVWPRPVIIDAEDVDACVGQNVTLSGSNSAADVLPLTYSWQGPNNIGPVLSNNNGPFNIVINNVQHTDAGLYTLTLISEAGCLSQPQEVTLTVNDGLNLVDVTPDQTYCEGSDITLTAYNTVGADIINYTWTVPNGNPVSGTAPSPGPIVLNIPNAGIDQEGPYTLNVSSQAGCTADPVTINVDIEPKVAIGGVTGGGKYCQGDSIALQAFGSGATGQVNYYWINANGDTICAGSAPATGPFPCSNIDSEPSSSGSYTLVVVTANGCQSEASASIEISGKPKVITVYPDSTLCELDTIFFYGQNGMPGVGNFIWSLSTPSGIVVSGTGFETDIFTDMLLPAVTYGEGTYTLILDNEGCPSDPVSFDLVLNPNPIISNIIGGGIHCEGDTVCLTFQNLNPAVFNFYHTCNYGSTQVTGTGTGTNPITFCITTPGFVFCSLESFDGCVSSLAGTQITFVDPPAFVTDSLIKICQSDTLFLSATNIASGQGNVFYTWRRPDNTILTTGTIPWNGTFAAFDPNPISGKYCLIGSIVVGGNPDCVSFQDACVNVIVNPLPEVIAGIDGGGTFCEGETITLTATVAIANGTPITYTWTKNGVPIATGVANSGEVIKLEISNSTSDASGVYCLQLVSSDGCEMEAPVCTQVTVNTAPQNCLVTGGGNFCEGTTVNLNGACEPGAGTVNYVWLGPNGLPLCSGTAPSQGPFPCSVPGVQDNQAGIYTLIVSIGDCESDPLSVTVGVNQVPEATASGGGTFCEGDMATLTFTVNPSGATSVNWTITGPLVDTSGTTTVTITITLPIDVVTATAGTYTLTVTSDAGCTGTPASTSLSVQQPQAISISATPNPLCPGSQLTLTTQAQQGTSVSYEWYKDGVLIGTTTVPTFTVNNAQSGQYSVIANVDACESVSSSVNVTAIAPPVANDDQFDGVVNTPVNGNVLGNDVTGGANVTITIVNQPAKGTVTINQNGTFTYVPNTAFTGEDQFTYRICLTACTSACDEAIVRIKVPDVPCIVPNVITPNGDNINDVLVIECVVLHPNNRFRVFNRWGDEIFVAEPYDNEWEGTYGDDKKPLPAATYFYLLQLDKNEKEFVSGYITIVR